MKVLVACEESQVVCKAFRERGHEAYSCDIQKCSGGHPEWHIKDDVLKHIYDGWDLIIMHPPCTYTALCGNRWYSNSALRLEGVNFTRECYFTALDFCEKVVLEQPKTIMQEYIGRKSQVIQPWQFGHNETKETWLWLKGLPLLLPSTPGMECLKHEHRIHRMPPSPDRGKLRSKTYSGIAKAMAEQWG